MNRIQFLFSLLVFTSVALGQEDDLYSKLTSGSEDSISALNTVLESTEEINSVTLFTASSVALQSERYSDAAYLFYIAKFRAQYDLEVFEPVGTGGDSPMALIGALSFQLGSTINPEIMKRPSDFSDAVDRASNWRPATSPGYDPGWEVKERKDTNLVDESILGKILEFEKGMGGLSRLLSNEEYFTAFRTVQDFNMTVEGEGPTKEDYDEAVVTMTEIEKSENIRGLFFNPENE